MRIFNKNSETTQAANLAIKKLKKFFDMTKSTTNNPVLKRNGAKNSCAYSYSETYKIRLTAMPPTPLLKERGARDYALIKVPLF